MTPIYAGRSKIHFHGAHGFVAPSISSAPSIFGGLTTGFFRPNSSVELPVYWRFPHGNKPALLAVPHREKRRGPDLNTWSKNGRPRTMLQE